jgi:hypothetical protein
MVDMGLRLQLKDFGKFAALIGAESVGGDSIPAQITSGVRLLL